jgi:hypothetical protein
MDQIADASKTAFSFLSTSLSTLGDSVMKTATALIDEKPSNSSTQALETNTSNRNTVNGNDEWATTWASFSSTASNLWKSAAVATADIMNNLQQESSSSSTEPGNNDNGQFYSNQINTSANDQSETVSFTVEETVHQNQRPEKAPNDPPKTGKGSSDDFFATFNL